jgi:hypothetical protein
MDYFKMKQITTEEELGEIKLPRVPSVRDV